MSLISLPEEKLDCNSFILLPALCICVSQRTGKMSDVLLVRKVAELDFLILWNNSLLIVDG